MNDISFDNIFSEKEKMLFVEEIRKRAKDSKSSNTLFFVTHTLDSIEKLTNILLLAAFGIVGYSATQSYAVPINFQLVLYSILFGVVSYLLSFLYFEMESLLNSDLEDNLSTAGITLETYNEKLETEKDLKSKYFRKKYYRFLSFSATTVQACLLALAFLIV